MFFGKLLLKLRESITGECMLWIPQKASADGRCLFDLFDVSCLDGIFPTERGRVLSKWLVTMVITHLPCLKVSVQWVITMLTNHLLSTPLRKEVLGAV